MLTLFFGSASRAFQMILKGFVRPPAKILDVTYGRGNSWKKFSQNTLVGTYQIVKMDLVKYEGVELDEQGDHSKPLPFENESFDAIYYDPPYYFREFVKGANLGKHLYNINEEVFWTLQDFKASLRGLRKEVPRVLKKGGILICKIMDGYVGRKYFPNSFCVFSSFSSILVPVGHFIVPIQRINYPDSVRVNHINYFVFKNGKDETGYEQAYSIKEFEKELEV